LRPRSSVMLASGKSAAAPQCLSAIRTVEFGESDFAGQPEQSGDSASIAALSQSQ
jgi:hypothetical protein